MLYNDNMLFEDNVNRVIECLFCVHCAMSFSSIFSSDLQNN